MILQALCEYYERKKDELAPEGFEGKAIPFLLLIDSEGNLIDLQSTKSENLKNGITYVVPQGVKKTSGIAANLLWDSVEYVLGVRCSDSGEFVTDEKLLEKKKAFVSKFKDNLPIQEEAIEAILKFYDNANIALITNVIQNPKELIGNPNISFKLLGDKYPIFSRPSIVSFMQKGDSGNSSSQICLLTADRSGTARLHTSIKGVRDAQTSGGNIISFNKTSFNSFGKEQGDNAPISNKAMFEYTTALNHLLARESTQKILVGDTTAVFWTERENALEDSFSYLLGEAPKDNPHLRADAIQALFNSIHNGAYVKADANERFYFLGLAPNAARLSIRFWSISTIAELALNISEYFSDLEIVQGNQTAWNKYPSIFRVLASIAVQGKAENIPPNLGGETIRAILTGQALPYTLLSAAVRRNVSTQNVDSTRAAILKAFHNRQYRKRNINQPPFTMSLDPHNPNVGYLLGRLFAVLEKIQEEANPGINSTIRDKFYGSFSSTPVSAFSQLMRLKNHHLSKLDNPGRRTNLEKRIQEVVGLLPTKVPSHLSLEDQGAFAIGYYHQRQDFFTSTSKTTQDA